MSSKTDRNTILSYTNTDPTHLDSWKNKIRIDGALTCGKIANCIITNQYDLPTLPDRSIFIDPEIYKLELRYFYDENAKFAVEKSKFFAFILSRLSEESVLQVQRCAIKFAVELRAARQDVVQTDHPSGKMIWNTFLAAGDPLELWKTIRYTHGTSRTESSRRDKDIATDSYVNLKMQKAESLERFTQRWEATVERLAASGAVVPSTEEQVTRYVRNLDQDRFGLLQIDCYNRESFDPDTAWPKTIEDAYLRASTFKTLQTLNQETPAQTGAIFLSASRPPKKYNHSSSAPATTGHMSTTPRNRGHHEPVHASTTQKPREHYESGHASTTSRARGHFESKKFKSQTKKGTTDRAPKRGCIICGEPHWNADCPHLKSCQELAKGKAHHNSTYESSHVVLKNTIQASKFSPDDVILDSGSGPNIFHNADLLNNIRPATTPLLLSGIDKASEPLEVSMAGDFGPFKDIYVHSQASANVLSLGKIEDNFKVTYNQGTDFTVHTGVKDFVFERKGLHWIFKHKADHHSFISTVTENEMKYSKRDVIGAREARTLVERLGYPSRQMVIDALRYGNINNVPLTAEDVHRCYDIYGPSLGELKGKTTRPRPSERLLRTDPDLDTTPKPGYMDIDIFNVSGVNFLLGLVTNIPSLRIVGMLSSKSGPAVLLTLNEMVAALSRKNWRVKIRTDGERGVAAVQDYLKDNGVNIDIDTVGPGRHVPPVERSIRVIKERVRAIINTLPYKAPRFLVKWAVYFAVSRLNLLSDHSGERPIDDRRSPREIFSGTKTDYKRDLRIAFGEYAQVYEPNITHVNSMTPRTRGAIALLPTGNSTGSVKFWCLETKSIITRDKWTSLPMPMDVISRINAEADKQGEMTVDLSEEHTEHPPEDPLMQIEQELAPQRVEDPNESLPVPQAPPEDQSAPVYSPGALVPVPPVYQEEPLVTGTPEHLIENDSTPAPTPEEPEIDQTDIPVHHAPEQRYGLRDRNTIRKPDRYEIGLHISIRKAKERYGTEANRCAAEEIQNLFHYDTMVGVHMSDLTPDERKSIIRSSMFIKEKFLPSGAFERLKARFVAGGNLQDRSLYEPAEISSPTVSTSSVFLLASIAAAQNRKVVTIDVQSAYLNAHITSKRVYIRVEPSIAAIMTQVSPDMTQFMNPDGSIIVKLNKALYGCIESAALWYEHLTKTLAQAGYVPTKSDPCVFTKNNGESVIGVHVDDIICAAIHQDEVDYVLQHLKEVYTTLKVREGPIHDYVGMVFEFSTGRVNVKMPGMIQNLLHENNINTTARTPAASHLFSIRDVPKLGKKDKDRFHSTTAKLLYIAKRARPDLLLAVSFLTTRVQDPDVDDQNKLLRALGYLNATQDLFLTLSPGHSISIVAYIDASHAVHPDAKGHTGATISIGQGAILCKSSKQKLVSKSSTESELIACSDFVSSIIAIRNLLLELGFIVPPATIFQDNMSTLKLIELGRPASERTKHVAVRFFFIKDRVDAKEIQLQYCPTSDMLADILTKPLHGSLFVKLRNQLLNCSEKSDCRGVL